MMLRCKDETHSPLPKDLQQIILSYLDLSEKNDNFQSTKDAFLYLPKKALEPAKYGDDLFNEYYQAGACNTKLGIIGWAQLALGLTSIILFIPAVAVSVPTGALVGLRDFSVFSKNKIKNRDKNQENDFYYFVNRNNPGLD